MVCFYVWIDVFYRVVNLGNVMLCEKGLVSFFCIFVCVSFSKLILFKWVIEYKYRIYSNLCKLIVELNKIIKDERLYLDELWRWWGEGKEWWKLGYYWWRYWEILGIC